VPHYNLWEPCCFTEVPDGPQTHILNILWLQKEAAQIHMPKQSQGFTLTQKLAEISSFAPHFLHNGLSVSLIKWRCLLRVLCPVVKPVTALDCILLKDKSLALVPRQGPKINSWTCLWVSRTLHHHPQCWFTNQQLILFLAPIWGSVADAN
jgi:hypothetical protein